MKCLTFFLFLYIEHPIVSWAISSVWSILKDNPVWAVVFVVAIIFVVIFAVIKDFVKAIASGVVA